MTHIIRLLNSSLFRKRVSPTLRALPLRLIAFSLIAWLWYEIYHSHFAAILDSTTCQARPVYLMLPTDIVHERIPAKRLLTPLNHDPPENDAETEAFVLDEIMKLVSQANEDVIILVDACAGRHNVKQELGELVKKTGFPVYAAPMGKSVVPESYERYGGVSAPHVCGGTR